MKKIYSFLMMLALMCVSTVAHAEEHVANITSDPENGYYSGYVSFPINEILAELGLADEAALEALLDAEGEGGAVYLKTTDGMSNDYTGNTNEFWMTSESVAIGYGEEAVWYAGLYYDPAGTDEETGEPYEAEFYTRVGQMPNVFSKIYTDSDLSCTLYLVNGDKIATFNVNLHVNAAPIPDDIYLSQLEIVENYTLPLTFMEGQTTAKKFSIDVENIYEKLGTSAEELDEQITAYLSNNIYVQVAETGLDETTQVITTTWLDRLQTMVESNTDGWFGRYSGYDEDSGNETVFELNAPLTWGNNGCTFYFHNTSLSDGVFTIEQVGLYGTTCKLGDTDYVNLYIVNGTKAICIKAQVEITEREVVDPNDMVLVGETTVQVSAIINNSYSTRSFKIDMGSICEALGCTIGDIEDVYTMSNGVISDAHNESSGGYWYNEAGELTPHGDNAAFFIALGSSTGVSDGSYTIGQMPDHFANITEPVTVKAQLVFQYLTNYYIVNVEYTVTLTDDTDRSDWTQVYAEAHEVQLIAAEGYAQDESCKTYLDLNAIVAAIGTDDPVLYGELWSGDTMSFSDAHSCDPKPGFWMASDGISVGSHGTGSAYGMSYAGGVITYYAMPGEQPTGATYESRFYLVNEENGKYAKITLNVEYVDARSIETEALGEANVVITLSKNAYDEEEDFYEGSEGLNWNEVVTALGIDESDIETSIWMVQNQSGKLFNIGTAASFFGESVGLNKNGYYVDVDNGGNSDDVEFAIGYNSATKNLTIALFDKKPEDGVLYKTKIALRSEAGYYVFNVTAGTELTVGINGVAAQKAKAGNVYDINGRKVSAPANGIYIIDGVKVYVK